MEYKLHCDQIKKISEGWRCAHQNSSAVTGIVELGALGQRPSPDADHIQVHVSMKADLGIVSVLGEAE